MTSPFEAESGDGGGVGVVNSPDDSPETVDPFMTPHPVNLPNAITLGRLVLALVIFGMIERGDVWVLCTVTFVVAVWTDYFDGYFARKWNQITMLGRIMDPFVDKMIIGGTLIFLTRHPESGVTPWITFIVIGREMFITGLRSVLEGHGIDFSAKWSGKLKMVVQSVAIPFCLLSMEYARLVPARDVLLWGMVLVTLYSGLEYCWRGWRMMKRRPGFEPPIEN